MLSFKNHMTSLLQVVTLSKPFHGFCGRVQLWRIGRNAPQIQWSKSNGHKALRLYEQRFPCHTFFSVDKQLWKTSLFIIWHCNARCSWNAQMPEMENKVLTRFKAIPTTSVWVVAYKIGIFQSRVWHIVHEECIHPYHMQKVQSCIQMITFARQALY